MRKATFSYGRLISVVSVVALMATGCAQVPHSRAMIVPPTPPSVTSAHSLKVAPVTGGLKTEGEESHLGDAEFQEALVSSLKNSGLFRLVTTTGPGDWTLQAKIVSQELRGSVHNTAELMVRYEILDANAHSLWASTIYASSELGVGEIFLGAERHRVVIENAARANIEKALDQIQRWLKIRTSR